MPASLLFAPGRPTNIENIVRDGQKAVAIIAVIAWHILDRSFLVSSYSSLIAQLADFLKAADPCEEWCEPF
jgi:hypothetical protein